ncbi:hypothetical protein M501DRAFT_409697 [Patellaria atrata CBS 101060]|uniref:Uncharacterized protein n=1 Tax=Patellaria atrata CBS 101060 TaxID=1346257 RepID=A0A9P4VUU5_9PEZI|nr:hypothetical protein M501DRAFT_409697 [Patellaria atrata CBS 101060]
MMGRFGRGNFGIRLDTPPGVRSARGRPGIGRFGSPSSRPGKGSPVFGIFRAGRGRLPNSGREPNAAGLRPRPPLGNGMPGRPSWPLIRLGFAVAPAELVKPPTGPTPVPSPRDGSPPAENMPKTIDKILAPRPRTEVRISEFSSVGTGSEPSRPGNSGTGRPGIGRPRIGRSGIGRPGIGRPGTSRSGRPGIGSSPESPGRGGTGSMLIVASSGVEGTLGIGGIGKPGSAGTDKPGSAGPGNPGTGGINDSELRAGRPDQTGTKPAQLNRVPLELQNLESALQRESAVVH